jgi:hypothetical protein
VVVSGEWGDVRRGQAERDRGKAMAMEMKWERVSLAAHTRGDKGGGTWGGERPVAAVEAVVSSDRRDQVGDVRTRDW